MLNQVLGAILALSTFASAGEPVWDTDFPDPGIVHASDGYYYVFGTQTVVSEPPGSPGRIENIQVGRSKDLQHWERMPDALPVKPRWASHTQNFWAPDASLHDGIYYLYFAAEADRRDGAMCVGVATSRSPGGPYADAGAPLRCGPGFRNIDPMAFDDPATGKRLLYWGSDFGPLLVQELAADRVHFAPGSAAISVLSPNPSPGSTDYDRLIEGAWVTKEGLYYYLFYSGDNCCATPPGPHYAVMVARATSAFGPFETLSGHRKVLISADRRWLAPGHNAVIRDDVGNLWLLFHAIDRRHPYLSATIDGDRDVRRVLLRRQLFFRNGWPVVPADGEPREVSGK